MKTAITALLALAGLPLFAVMALSAYLAHREAEIDLTGIFVSFYRIAETPLLTSLPLFAFAGTLVAHSNAPRRLLQLANALVGWVPGGLAVVTFLACSVLTTITGATGVTIIALGGLVAPALRAQGYSQEFTLGAITAGGSLGLLFPPSLPVILYGVVSETDIQDLFLAGTIPGLLIIVALCGYAVVHSVRHGLPRTPFAPREVVRALRAAWAEVPIPILVTAGIFTGFLSASEAAVTAASLVLLVEGAIYREVPLARLGAIARESAVLVGGIFVILGLSFAVTNVVIDAELPQKLFELVRPWMSSQVAFLIALNLFLLFVGCMIDIYAAIVLIVPLLVPLAADFQVHPVHLGIIFLANLGIGYVTPPVGMSLFIASVRFGEPILRLYRASLPFLVLMLLALAAITFLPALSLAPLEFGR